MRERVVLFDLDGTVVTFLGTPPGPGRTALESAMEERFGVPRASVGIRVAGGTDRALARAMLARAGVPGDEEQINGIINHILARYVVHLAAVLQTRRYRPIGNVTGTVQALQAAGAVVGVATGNVREGARLKLASAGLDGVFDLSRGGFGCDAEPRAEIVRIAADRCLSLLGLSFLGSSSFGLSDPGSSDRERVVVVVGDTEHDVRAGRAIGARVVGVATDDASRAELAAAGADAIVDGCGPGLVEAALA